MKIGILTFHNAQNYGAILQCYALQRFLRNENHEVYVIDYKNKDISSCYNIFNYKRYVGGGFVGSLKRTVKEIFLLYSRIKRHKKFKQFIRCELNLLNVKSISRMDLIIIGSDQVWNNTLTGGLDPMYWGNMGIPYGGRIASYAASMQDNWDSSLNDQILNYLCRFSNISVREKSLKEGLLSIGVSKSIDLVVDPTLLLSQKDWNVLCKTSPSLCNDYVFLYMAEYFEESYMLANLFAKNHNLNLKVLTSGLTKYDSEEIRGAGPVDFLNLIKNARFVLCSSFHGTIFSILYNKPFVTIAANKNKNNRVLNLLAELGLSDRVVQNNIDSVESIIDVTYSVNLRKCKIYFDSISYLSKICN